jgi:putative SOS response-associated peptidase YedK
MMGGTVMERRIFVVACKRCPLILEPKDYERWLAPSAPAQLPVDLLSPPDAETMRAWRVAPLKGNGPQLLHPPKV